MLLTREDFAFFPPNRRRLPSLGIRPDVDCIQNVACLVCPGDL